MRSGSRHSTDGPGFRAALSGAALRVQSDHRLVALTRAGSEPAFAAIVERYRGPLLGYCGRLVGPDEGEDAVQQTFTNAFRALQADDRAIELRPWLYRIAHNVAVNALSRSGRNYEPLGDQLDGVPQPPGVFAEKERVERLFSAIDGLPARQRQAMVARELEGRSYDEIARGMDEATPVVRQLIYRARTRLRDACGALVPVWALRWLLVAGPAPAGSERLGEVVAGGGAGLTVVKAAAVVLAAGAIATGAGGLAGKGDKLSGNEAAALDAPRHVPPKADGAVAGVRTPRSQPIRGSAGGTRGSEDSKVGRDQGSRAETNPQRHPDGGEHGDRVGSDSDGAASDSGEASREASHEGSGEDQLDGSGDGGDSGDVQSAPSDSSEGPDSSETYSSPDTTVEPYLQP